MLVQLVIRRRRGSEGAGKEGRKLYQRAGKLIWKLLSTPNHSIGLARSLALGNGALLDGADCCRFHFQAGPKAHALVTMEANCKAH